MNITVLIPIVSHKNALSLHLTWEKCREIMNHPWHPCPKGVIGGSPQSPHMWPLILRSHYIRTRSPRFAKFLDF